MANTPRATLLVLGVVLSLAVVGLSAGAVDDGASAPVVIELTGPDVASPGDSLTIVAEITADTEIYGVQFTIEFSPDDSTVNGVSKGGFLSKDASSVVVANDVEGDRIEYGETRTGTDTGVTGSGDLAVIDIEVSDSTSADALSLTFVSIKVSDSDANSVDVTTSDVEIPIVHEEQSTPTATDTATGVETVTSSPTRTTQGGTSDDTPTTTVTITSTTGRSTSPSANQPDTPSPESGNTAKTPQTETSTVVHTDDSPSRKTSATLIPTPTSSPARGTSQGTKTPGQAGLGFLSTLAAIWIGIFMYRTIDRTTVNDNREPD